MLYFYYAVSATAEAVTVSAAEVPVSVSVSETVSVSVTVSGSVVVGAGLVVVSAGVSEMMTACMPIMNAHSQVLGVVRFSVPCLGAAAMALRSPGGIAVCVVIFALAFLLWTLADKFKKRESFK